MIIGFAGILLVVTNDPVEGAAKECEYTKTSNGFRSSFCDGNIKWFTPGGSTMQVTDGTDTWFVDRAILPPRDPNVKQGDKIQFLLGSPKVDDIRYIGK